MISFNNNKRNDYPLFYILFYSQNIKDLYAYYYISTENTQTARQQHLLQNYSYDYIRKEQ